MGWFSNLFKKAPSDKRFAKTMNGFLPIYSQFGTNIYASDVVQQAVSCIVKEIKKLRPMHVRYTGSNPNPVLDSTIQSVLEDPNPVMTTSEFLEKVGWLLMLNYNAFIIPTYRTWKEGNVERRYYDALYPINPTQVDFIEDASGKLFVTFTFWNGETTTIKYADCIHIKYRYSVNEYMGGNMLGQPDNEALLKTLELNDQLLKGIAKAMKASYAVNGVVKYNTLLDEGKTEAALAELERKLASNESGFLPLDLKTDFTPLPKQTQIVQEDTLRFIDEKILRNFGVPLCILKGDYTPAQYEAFYQSTIEDIVIAFSQAFTKKVFTKRERGYGNRIKFYTKDLVFMSMDQKLRMIEILSPTGGMFENEKRSALGMAPLPELENVRYMSLNWINAADASAYQTGKENVNVDIVDEEKEEV